VRNNQLVLFNWLAFGITPICLITFSSLWLFVRVVTQKRRVQQRVHWRQYRRMVIQLLMVSCLYIFFDAPAVIIGLIQLTRTTVAFDVQILYLYYIVYLLPLLIPFVCLSTFRELWTKTRVQVYPLRLLTHFHTTKRNEKAKPIFRRIQTTKM
jgi:heme exporter protein D